MALKTEVKNCRENSRDALRGGSSSPEVRGTAVGRWKISSRRGYGIGLILGKEITKGTSLCTPVHCPGEDGKIGFFVTAVEETGESIKYG